MNVVKIYEENKKVLYVPLHLWFSKNLESAIPYFKLYDGDKVDNKIRIKLKASH